MSSRRCTKYVPLHASPKIVYYRHTKNKKENLNKMLLLQKNISINIIPGLKSSDYVLATGKYVKNIQLCCNNNLAVQYFKSTYKPRLDIYKFRI